MTVKFLPYIESDGCWTMRDTDIMAIYDRIEGQGLTDTVFYEHETSREWFLDAMKHGENQLYVVFDGPTVAGIAWLNRFEGRAARVHFCFFDGFRDQAVEIAKTWLDRILHMKTDSGEYIYDLLMGLTPAWNQPALMFLKAVGAVAAATIPNAVYNRTAGASQPAVISYFSREELL